MHSSSALPAPVEPAGHFSLTVARLGRASAELSRNIGRGCHTALPSVAPDAILSLESADGASADGGWLHLGGAFGQIAVSEGVRFVRALTGIDLGPAAEAQPGPGSALPAGHAWLRTVLCGRMSATPFGVLDALAARPLREQPKEQQVWLRMTLRTGNHAIVSYAVSTAPEWLRFMAGASWTADAPPEERNAAFPLKLTALLARHRLPANVLGALRPGDVILPALTRFNCAGEGVLRCGGMTLQVHFLAPCSLTILALEKNMMTDDWLDEAATPDMARAGDNQPAQPELSAGAPEGGVEAVARDGEGMPATVFDSLPVSLDFELGHATLTLGALRRLTAGTTLLLDGGGQAAVAIVSAGRRIGLGEAVDVDGQLGIRIVEWDAA
jgi:type III secretion protein Q